MKRSLKKEAGFTLVELLVVVGIIVALAAVIVPNVARFTGSGEAASAEGEFDTIQAAIDTAMAEKALAAVEIQSTVSDFASTGGAYIDDPDGTPGNGDEIYLYPDYLRVDTADPGRTYSWDATGLVTQTIS